MPPGLKREVAEVAEAVAKREERATLRDAANQDDLAAQAVTRRLERADPRRPAVRAAQGAGSESKTLSRGRVLGPKETQTPRLDILAGCG